MLLKLLFTPYSGFSNPNINGGNCQKCFQPLIINFNKLSFVIRNFKKFIYSDLQSNLLNYFENLPSLNYDKQF